MTWYTTTTAKHWLELAPVVLDTETTGLGDDDEIVEIGIIDSNGATLLHSLVKPVNPIPAEATAIHGITNEMVADAPDIFQLYDRLSTVLEKRTVLIYNKEYDVRLIEQSLYQQLKSIELRHHHLYTPQINAFTNQLKENSVCVMQLYAEHCGEWDETRQQYKWHKLINAAKRFGTDRPDAHRAVADCRMTLDVVRAMAESPVVTSKEVTP